MLKRLLEAPKAGAESARTGLNPRITATAFVAFVLIWTLYVTISNLGASVHDDMAEAYAWGREFQLGYRHPPLWAWICGLWFSVFPRAGWSFALLSSLNAGLGLLGSWRLIGCFAVGDKRIAATLLLLLTPFYTFLSWTYNANTIFLSIWPWTLFAFMRAIDSGALGHAIRFGILMACALLSKYYAAILALTCFLAAIQHPARARYFLSPSPYVSAAVAAALFAPHFYWLVAKGAPPLQYLSDISGRGISFVASHAALSFFSALAENAVPVAIVALFAIVGRARRGRALATPHARAVEPRFRLVTTLAVAPLILTIVASFVFRNKIAPTMMIGTFSLVPLLAIEIFGSPDPARLRKVAVWASGALLLGALTASPAVAVILAWFSKDSYELEPRRELAAAATELWRAKTAASLAYVGGGHRYDEQVAFYAPGRPHDFIDLDVRTSPWIDLGDLAKRGLLIVCLRDDAACRDRTRALATPPSTETELTLAHRAWGHVAEPVTFVVTVIPPQGG